jgi:hypothetical protein
MKATRSEIKLLPRCVRSALAGIALMALLLAREARGFSLIGPYTAWMLPSLNYQQPDDIGGPMNLNEEYRWNVPVVTYGFDQSFLDYFGSNGVVAVEQAIQTVNGLPRAANLVLSDFPLSSEQVNFQAQADGLIDLKSETLALLLEHLGLAQPVRNIFDLAPLAPPNETDRGILERNFDPENLAPSYYVNQTLYTSNGSPGFPVLPTNDVVEILVDPVAFANHPVAERSLGPGGFYTGLTRDDAGGLRYLLSETNVNFESLPARTRAQVRSAWRPGVEKISFARHPLDRRGKFKSITLPWIDTYLVNGARKQQLAKRTIRQPDFLFSAADIGSNSPSMFSYLRTGTTNWINCAAANGNATNAGPGIICPPVKITFHQLGPLAVTGDSYPPQVINRSWASFDGSPNTPATYPSGLPAATFSIRLRAHDPAISLSLDPNAFPFLAVNATFHLDVPLGGPAALQISTNQTDWTSLCTVTNTGGVTDWYYSGHIIGMISGPGPMAVTITNAVFFRAVPQPAD